MQPHKYALIFPMATEEELVAMAEDIKIHGLLNKIIIYEEKILDGRNRFESCKRAGVKPEYENYKGTNALSDVISWNLHRRHLSTSQRAALAVDLEPMFKEEAKKRMLAGKADPKANLPQGQTRDQAAEVMKVSGRSVTDAKAIKDRSPEVFEDVKAGRKTVHEAKKELRTAEITISRQKMADEGKLLTNDDRCKLEVGDIKTYKTEDRYDFIITDPPYPHEFVELYEVLAKRALTWLKPGGLLIAMCGQSYVDEIIKSMSKYLEYYWMAAYMTPGQPKPLRQVQVNCSWKPLLMFLRPGDKYKGKIFTDVFISDRNEKVSHEWQQSESGMRSIITSVCLPGQSIMDPFVGSGTTGIAALDHGCRFTGIDLDEKNVNISKVRTKNHLPGRKI